MRPVVTLELDETGMLVAECPPIPGCVSQGTTEEEALENLGEAVQARVANGMPVTVDVRKIEVPV